MNFNNTNLITSNISIKQPSYLNCLAQPQHPQSFQLQSAQHHHHHQIMSESHFISVDENDSIYSKNNNNTCGINNNTTNLTLKQQAMLNQFVSISGVSYEEALKFLVSSNWQYQSALSVFFDDFSIITPPPSYHIHQLGKPLIPFNNNNLNNPGVNNLSICAPSNTPVTPPNLEYLEKAFSKLNATFNSVTSSSSASSPLSNFNS